MGCKYRVMDRCTAEDNIKDAYCFGKDCCLYYEDEVETISKADYEARLKADLAAMLAEIQLEIEEKASAEGDQTFAEGERFCANLIQQRINSLKTKK